MSCRLHGPGCAVPWGYDPAHTDSPRPYTLAELQARPEPPHRYAYPDVEAYRQGFYLWRALLRDGRLNEAEAAVRLAGLEEEIRKRAGPGR